MAGAGGGVAVRRGGRRPGGRHHPRFDRRVAVLRAHASHIGDWDVGATMATHMPATGAPHGHAFAESFRVVSLRR